MIDNQQMENEVSYFLNSIKKHVDLSDIRTILDLGTADLGASIIFSKLFPNAKIVAFECNPESIERCKTTLKQFNFPNIIFVDKAVSNENKILDFYPIDMEKSPVKNDKAGSIFKLNPKYVNFIESVKQVESPIKVESVRIKDYLYNIGIEKVDIVWSDIQGAELLALQGMEDLIDNLKALQAEVQFEHLSNYLENPCQKDLEKFLFAKNFERLPCHVYSEEALQNPEIHLPHVSWTNSIYINRKHKI